MNGLLYVIYDHICIYIYMYIYMMRHMSSIRHTQGLLSRAEVKFMQDLATLRCKQNRQQEAAELLEEVARRTPPHEATLRNLGTVYNMLRDHDKAGEGLETASKTCF